MNLRLVRELACSVILAWLPKLERRGVVTSFSQYFAR